MAEAKRVRSVGLKLWLTPAEHEVAKAIARERGISVADLFRTAALGDLARSVEDGRRKQRGDRG